ncbi:unnamed protein product [Mytilus coruscus]|nr:unnamed protein product [Mytilus coruscus]
MDRKGNCPQLNKLLEQQIKQCIESMQTSGEASANSTQDRLVGTGSQSSGDASLVKTSQLRQKPAIGDASLAGSQQSSKDALLDKASSQSQSQSLSAHQANGDASLVKTSQLRQIPASGNASLAGSQQSSKDALLDKASRDALMAIKTYERGILHQSSSGDASLEKILQSSPNPASRDALLPGQQQSSGDASLDKSIELNMTNTDNSLDNLLMILCSIFAKSVNGLVTPTYFCCRCEQTMHAHCEKDRVANVEDMKMTIYALHVHKWTKLCPTVKKTTGLKQQSTTQQQKIERHVQGKQQLLSLKKTPS